MCGIVGLFLKNPKLENKLGDLLADMLLEMTERGPDSVGFAIYSKTDNHKTKCILLNSQADDNKAFDLLNSTLKQSFGNDFNVQITESHALISVPISSQEVIKWVNKNFPELSINSSGKTIEIYKETGLPKDVIKKFHLKSFTGTHALGHTRMATESAVTTCHSHPFSTGDDICLVHNGSLSNHNIWRRKLQKKGISITTDNDSEVAAAYFNWKLLQGKTLDESLTSALDDLDGFYTFAIGTKDGFAVMRDPIGCKPAVIAETDDWVGMASEFRALAQLPNIESAKIWEPTPGRIYSWHKKVA